MTDVTKAIAELRAYDPINPMWTEDDLRLMHNESELLRERAATVLNAAASGTMIPRADAELAMALIVEKAGELSARGWRQEWDATHEIRALAPAFSLAELQALRSANEQLLIMAAEEQSARKTAEAELATLRDRVERLTGAVDGAVMAMKSARGVIASKHEHAQLTGALVMCAEAKAGISYAALTEGAAL